MNGFFLRGRRGCFSDFYLYPVQVGHWRLRRWESTRQTDTCLSRQILCPAPPLSFVFPPDGGVPWTVPCSGDMERGKSGCWCLRQWFVIRGPVVLLVLSNLQVSGKIQAVSLVQRKSWNSLSLTREDEVHMLSDKAPTSLSLLILLKLLYQITNHIENQHCRTVDVN